MFVLHVQELCTDITTSLGEMKEANSSEVPSKRLLALRTAEANLRMVEMETGNISLPVNSFKLQVRLCGRGLTNVHVIIPL